MDPHAIVADDPIACYRALLKLVHPQGLRCPGCGRRRGWQVHRTHRTPVVDYRCRHCHRVFNAWTGTLLHNTHLPPEVLWRLVEAISRNEPLAPLARELGRARSSLQRWQHRLRQLLQGPSQAS